MLRKSPLALLVISAVCVLLLIGVCSAKSKSKAPNYQRAIVLDGCESLEVNVDSPLTGPRIIGGTTNLVAIGFDTRQSESEPMIDFRHVDKAGVVTLSQADIGTPLPKKDRTTWDVKLPSDLPTRIRVNSGFGDIGLNLDEIQAVDVTVKTASGNISVEASGEHPALLDLYADTGTGNINLKMSGGYPSLRDIRFNAGTGDISADLSGKWSRDLTMTLTSSGGNVKLKLPRDIGVEVRASSAIGEVKAKDVEKRGGAYVNDAYGKTPITLRITVQTGMGDTILSVAK